MSIPTPTYPGVTITRNAQGWPIIDAPTIELAYEAFGYMVATDRGFQLFERIMAANGMLASYRGPVAVPSDEDNLRYIYTEADATAQVAQWTPQIRNLLFAYTRGMNARYSEMLAGTAPTPLQFSLLNVAPRTFTPYQLLNVAYHELRSNNVVNLQIQLLILGGYLNIAATNPGSAEAIFSDIVGINGVTKQRWTLTTGDACGTVGDVAGFVPSVGAALQPQLLAGVQTQMQKIQQIQTYRQSLGIASKTGSFSIVMGPSVVAGNGATMTNTLSMGAPQNEYTAPSAIYIAILNTPNYKADNPHFVGMPLLPNSGSNIVNGCYCYNMHIHTGYRNAQYYAIEPVTNAVPYATYTIEVRGAAPVTFTAQRSTSSGYVAGPFLIPGSMLVVRSVHVNDILLGMDPIARLFFLNNFSDWQNFPNFPNQTDITITVYTMHDNQGNVGAVYPGQRVLPPPGVNPKLPQVAEPFQPFLFDNPLPPIESFTVTPPRSSFNEQPYYAYWNGGWDPLEQDFSTVFYEYTRVWWLYHLMDGMTNITYAQLRDLFVRVFDTRLLADKHALTVDPVDTSIAPLSAQSDVFLLLRDRFFAAVNANPTPQRLALLSLLASYDGSFIGGDIENRINSLNVQDAWFLANTWVANVAYAMFSVYAPAFFPPKPVPWFCTPYILPLLIRVLINPCNNPIFYNGYPGPAAQNAIIVAALDQAFAELNAFLGPQPWGTGLRAIFAYVNEFAGVEGTLPWIQHGSEDTITDMRSVGVAQRSFTTAPGVTEEIISTPMGIVAGASATNLMDDFREFNFVNFGPKTVPLSCLVGTAPGNISRGPIVYPGPAPLNCIPRLFC